MRNSKEIRVWMIRNGHTTESIRKALGYSSHTPVSLTIAGSRNSLRVLGYLLKHGCPAKHLGLPEHMEKVA